MVVRFNDLGKARHALHELKALDRDRGLRVSAAALRAATGRRRERHARGSDAEGFYVPEGGSSA